MPEPSATAPSRPRIHPIAVVATIAGVLLFIYTLQAAGRATFSVSSARSASASSSSLRCRPSAWPSAPGVVAVCGRYRTLHVRSGLQGVFTGDAVGNVLPLGPLASEGTKALLIRRNIATSAAFSSVVLENIFYSISVAIMVMVGTLAFLMGYQPANAALTIALSLGVVAIALLVAVWWLMRSQPPLLSRFLKHDAVRDAEDRIFRFSQTRPKHVWQILLLQFAFHATAVFEIYFLLRLLVGHTERTLLMAVIFATVERLIMIAFKLYGAWAWTMRAREASRK